MPAVTVRLAEPGDYLQGEDGAIYVGATHGQDHFGPTGADLDTPAAAHEFYADEGYDGDEVEWVHPTILRGRIVTPRDVDNCDAHEDAEVGDTTYDYVTEHPDTALRELGPNEVRLWERGTWRAHWSMTPTGRVFLHPDERRETEYEVTVEGKPVGTHPSHDEAWAAVQAASAIEVEAWKVAHPEYRVREHLYLIEIDLTDSKMGPSWRSTRNLCGIPVGSDTTPADLREMAAEHYNVPLSQVSEPQPITSAEFDRLTDEAPE